MPFWIRHKAHSLLLLPWLLLLVILAGCTAQIRNGDAIKQDTHFIYANSELQPDQENEADDLLTTLGSPEAGAEQRNDYALLLIQDLQIDRGEILFFELLGQNARYGPAYWNLGRLYALLGETERAERIYRRAVLQSGWSVQKLHVQALQLDGQNRQWEARHLMQAIFNERADPASGLWLAGLAYTRGDISVALNYYETILHRQPKNAAAYFGAGLIYYEGGNHRLAQSYLERAHQYKSREPRLIYLLASSLHTQDKLADALRLIKQDMPAQPSAELIRFYGDLLLEENFQRDVRFLLRYRPSGEGNGLLQHWYGGRPEIYLKEIVPEFQKAY